MCPSIKKSCCRKEDQEVIYTNWIEGQEEENVNKRFEENSEIYKKLLDNIVKV